LLPETIDAGTVTAGVIPVAAIMYV